MAILQAAMRHGEHLAQPISNGWQRAAISRESIKLPAPVIQSVPSLPLHHVTLSLAISLTVMASVFSLLPCSGT